MQRILVTGGAGFIGSHTCLSLLQKGYDVVVLDSFFNSSPASISSVINILKNQNETNISNIEIIRGDIRDEEFLKNIFSLSQDSGSPISAVLHFAGLKSVGESVSNPLLYWDVNVNGSLKLLSVMDKYECRTIVFSSSATIYGISNKKQLSEDTNISPINPYGTTKATVEKLLFDTYNSSFDKWRIANLRYFNPIGAHFSGMIGESPLGIPNNIFPYITQVAAGNLKELTVFGNDWPTRDGTGVRDYIHVMDLAEGHIAALEYLFGKNPQTVNFNIGTGEGFSVLELINAFETVNNLKIPYRISDRRSGDVASVIADNSFALSCLDWSPKRSLEQMCLDGWKWQSLNPNGYE